MKRTFIAAAMVTAVLLSGGCMKKAGSEEGIGKIPIFNALTGKVGQTDAVKKSDAEWKKLLNPKQYEVTRKKGTERPFSGKCETGKGAGVYRCAGCQTDLFGVDTKFDSGTGWPSFWTPISELNVRTESDRSLGAERVEVLCRRCGAHLGHVFEDGPPPTEKRYCINAAALTFIPAPAGVKRTETATFAAGCFWGVEEVFRKIKGVVYTRVGYTGGKTKDPTYEDVCSDRTGHAEAIEIFYDPSKVTYAELLDAFWKMHDPTTPNRQGPDIGTQYRSAIFYHDKAGRDAAVASKEKLEKSGAFRSPIVTQILHAGEFYPAEEYHQQYHEKRGGSCRVE